MERHVLGVFDGLMMLPGDDVEMLGLVLIDEMNALELVLVRVEAAGEVWSVSKITPDVEIRI